MTPDKPVVTNTKTPTGHQISVQARTMAEARKILKDIQRKYPKTDAEEILANTVMEVTHPEEPITARVDRQSALCGALAATVLERRLTPFEDAALTAVITVLARRPEPILGDVVHLLIEPPPDATAHCRCTPGEFVTRLEAVVWALTKLLDRSLRSMFDGPSTVTLDTDGSGVLLDLSGVHHDPAALAVVLAAATSWLHGALATGNRRRLLVLDEAWAVLASEPTVRFLQASWKLARAYGVANIAIIHRLSDLRAQTDDGTATAKIAAGLLADSNTRILFRQSPDQAADARTLLGLTTTETAVLTRLARGRALWKINGDTAVVQHHLSERERVLCDSDTHMTA